MHQANELATPEQLREATRLLALFNDPDYTYHNGTKAEREEHKRILAETIQAKGMGEWDMGDAIHEARYFLAIDCQECGEELTEDYQLREGYCSRECWVAAGC